MMKLIEEHDDENEAPDYSLVKKAMYQKFKAFHRSYSSVRTKWKTLTSISVRDQPYSPVEIDLTFQNFIYNQPLVLIFGKFTGCLRETRFDQFRKWWVRLRGASFVSAGMFVMRFSISLLGGPNRQIQKRARCLNIPV